MGRFDVTVSMRYLAVMITSILLLAACGDSDSSVTTDGPTDSVAITTPDTIPIEDVRVPSGSGGLGGLFATAEDAEPPIDEVMVPCDDLDDCGGASDRGERCYDECDDDVVPITSSTVPFVPAPEHRLYCATLADFEDRDVPDLDTADGLEIINSWLSELAATTSPPASTSIDRLGANLTELLGLLDEEGLDPTADLEESSELASTVARMAREVEEDAEIMESFTEWACFGEGSYEPPTPVDPAIEAYCESFIEMTLLAEGDPEGDELIDVVAIWFDETEATVPAAIEDDFAIFHRWFDDARLETSVSELDETLDSAPLEVQQAIDRFGSWSDSNCDI